MVSIYDQDLPQTDANYRVLSPLDFIERSAFVYPDYPALVYGPAQNGIKMSWSQLYARTRQWGSALSKAGVGKGDTVAVMDDGRVVHRGAMAGLAADVTLQERLMGLSLEAHQ